jgi:hypothetical protein
VTTLPTFLELGAKRTSNHTLLSSQWSIQSYGIILLVSLLRVDEEKEMPCHETAKSHSALERRVDRERLQSILETTIYGRGLRLFNSRSVYSASAAPFSILSSLS